MVTASTAVWGNDGTGSVSTMVCLAFPLAIGRGFGRGLATTVARGTSTDEELDCTCVVDEEPSP